MAITDKRAHMKLASQQTGKLPPTGSKVKAFFFEENS